MQVAVSQVKARSGTAMPLLRLTMFFTGINSIPPYLTINSWVKQIKIHRWGATGRRSHLFPSW
jgi:hypothetical protein